MAITLPVDFTSRARIRYADYVTIVHIYYSGVQSYKFASKSCVIDGSQYLGIVEDVDSLTETWNVFGENNVSISVPSITLQDYTAETSYGATYQFSDEFAQTGIVGSRVDIRLGYIGTSLSNFVKIFDGSIENITIDDKITIECRSNELPDDNINGRQISYKLQTLGGEDVQNKLTIPKEADGLYLPVVFGQHWNSPMVCLNVENFAYTDDEGIPQLDASTFWCENDVKYQPNLIINSSVSQIKRYYQPNCGISGQLVYLFQEGQSTSESKASLDLADGDIQYDGYVPAYEIAYRGFPLGNFFSNVWTFSGVQFPGIRVSFPNENGNINTDYSWFCNVPLRMYLQEGTNFLASGVRSSDGASNIYKIFDGTTSTFTYSNSGITDIFQSLPERPVWFPTCVSGVGSPKSIYVAVDVPLAQNLRTDDKFAVHKNRPIFIPEKQITGDEYNMLMMGRTTTTLSGTVGFYEGNAYIGRYFYAFIGSTPDINDISWANKIAVSGYKNFLGATFFGVNANIKNYNNVWSTTSTSGYNFTSYPYNYYGFTLGDHFIDFANDDIEYSHNVASTNNYIGDAGNMISSVESNMGTYPFLQRKVLLKDLKGILQFTIQAENIVTTETIRDVYWESFENIPFDLGGHIYTHMSGIMIDNSDLVMLSCDDTGPINGYMLKRPNEYLEMIYQSKISGGLSESSYNYNEWALSDDDWKEVYGTVRDKSGFVLVDEISASEFVKEYCKDELFTSYRDNLGLFRFVIIPKDPLTIAINSVVIDYFDLENSRTFYSPYANLCTEIKSLKTDYVYANETYVNDTAWKISEADSYNFSFWKNTNSYSNNGLVKDEMDKKYTSYTDPSVVSYSGVWYTCQLSHTSNSSYVTHSHSDPGYDDGRYWVRCTSGLVPPNGSAWTTSTKYYGYDAEAEVIASLYINQWANLHRMVEIETRVGSYYTLEIGDIVEFTNMPKTWAGLTIKGWAGDTTTSGIVVNGQTVTHKGIVTSVTRTTNSIKATIMQLHKLDDIQVTRVK